MLFFNIDTSTGITRENTFSRVLKCKYQAGTLLGDPVWLGGAPFNKLLRQSNTFGFGKPSVGLTRAVQELYAFDEYACGPQIRKFE